ncbi:hypothetical protein ACHHYP_20759 [Achlya hypogyna]|uniref:Uncharacterized protein n=1 Tax=Achlya hypogyna TaxID=1202772 RepID=A0A1V9YBV6_ACHHY|nr:hypothetical protein ACHHYP_20759 [Achlya hypogyna]
MTRAKRVHLNNEQRDQLRALIDRDSIKGVATLTILGTHATTMSVSAATARWIYLRGGSKDGVYRSVQHRRTGKCGRRLLYPDLAARIRASFQSLSHATGVPATTLWRRYKAGFFKKYTRPLKPALTASNKFRKSEVRDLVRLFQLPKRVIPRNRYSAPAIEALCILLHRLAWPIRLGAMVPMFGRSRVAICGLCIAILDHVHYRFGHLLDWDAQWLDSAWMAACAAKEAPR